MFNWQINLQLACCKSKEQAGIAQSQEKKKRGSFSTNFESNIEHSRNSFFQLSTECIKGVLKNRPFAQMDAKWAMKNRIRYALRLSACSIENALSLEHKMVVLSRIPLCCARLPLSPKSCSRCTISYEIFCFSSSGSSFRRFSSRVKTFCSLFTFGIQNFSGLDCSTEN